MLATGSHEPEDHAGCMRHPSTSSAQQTASYCTTNQLAAPGHLYIFSFRRSSRSAPVESHFGNTVVHWFNPRVLYYYHLVSPPTGAGTRTATAAAGMESWSSANTTLVQRRDGRFADIQPELKQLKRLSEIYYP